MTSATSTGLATWWRANSLIKMAAAIRVYRERRPMCRHA